jgi:hypothetical protein
VFPSYRSSFEQAAFLSALLVTFAIIAVYGEQANPYGGYDDWAADAVAWLSLLQMISSLCFALCYFIIDAPVTVANHLKNESDAKALAHSNMLAAPDGSEFGVSTTAADAGLGEQSSEMLSPASPMAMSPVSSAMLAPIETRSGTEWCSNFEDGGPKPPEQVSQMSSLGMFLAQSWLLCRLETECYYMLLFFSVSIFGAVWNIFAFPFLLLHILRMDTGAVVLKSMRAGGQPLLQSMYVTIIVILLFGFITYLVFEEDVENCDSVFRCVFTHLFVGFSRDLGDVFNENAFAIPHNVKKTDAGRVIGRTVFVWVYFVLWVVLLQGVIQGQIVDAFASIRDEEDADKEDLLQKCFVCSKERHEFASLSGGFNNHVEDNHNPWSYLGFLLALQEKDSIDYTGLES